MAMAESTRIDSKMEETRNASSEQTRPTLQRPWQTERPPATTNSSLFSPATLKRNGTNTNSSMLNEAIWNTPQEDDTTSSSSEDEEQEKEKKSGRLHGYGQRYKKEDRRSYSRFNVGNDDYKTKGKVSKRDGRLYISVNETNNKGYLAKALGAGFPKHLGGGEINGAPGPRKSTESDKKETGPLNTSSGSITMPKAPIPRLNIVVMVIGSRGDIQPFLKLGKNLKEHGHRVRIATHPAFRDFVQKDSRLEFFSVGGDPAELMAFMVKNPGMIPTMDTLKKGEVSRRRDQMAEMFEGFWRACINATDDEKDVNNVRMMGDKAPFIADAIIANPPCFAHIHCAERLGVPLHLMFTFPYTPTQAFPHPLANIKKMNVDPGYANFMSYPLVEMMTWQGLGDLVNNFRVKTLGLEPVSTLWAPGQLYRLKVPYTYLWSPGLVPKPEDWGPEIDIAGFVFLDLASSFKPPEELVKFLDDGESPIYIGFGSIVVDDPDKFTKMIFEAVKKAGVRALVSKGWGGLGDDNTPENVFMLENTPHDWLFPKVKGVVHHGGAGTTAIGLKCGKPTMIVPFFGDQQFWGSMIGEAGAGAKPVPYKSLTADKLADGIKQLLTDSAREAAEKIAKAIKEEGDGAQNAVKSFHRSLTLRGLNSMRCSILEDRVAVWNFKNTNLRLCALAAEFLAEKKRISWKQLRLIRHNEWNDFEGPGEPLTGVMTAVMGTMTGIATGVGSVPFKLAKSSKRRARHEEKKKRKSGEGRSGNGRDSIEGKTNKQTNGIVKNDENKRLSGAAKINESQQLNGEPKANLTSPPTPYSPQDGTIVGPELNKKTSLGEPMAQYQDAMAEEQHTKRKEDNEQQDEDNSGTQSELSDDPDEPAAMEIAQDVGKGLGKTAEVIVRAPMDLSLALSQGFHNAPRLYGDTTVRRPIHITGIHSGLKAAGQEFIFGIYDGFSGLVIQPYTGARDSGVLGFIKGIGMGLTGFVLKDIAAVIGPFGYTLKGVHKEFLKHKQPTHFIRKARILEGVRDLKDLDSGEKGKAEKEVEHGWSIVTQVWEMLEKEKRNDVVGKVKVMRQRENWKVNGAFENVWMAEKALEARRRGENLEDVFRRQRRELELVDKSRKGVVDEMDHVEKREGQEKAVKKEGSAGPDAKRKPSLSD